MEPYTPRRMPNEAELQDVQAHWDESGRDYDPARGDHVDHLNDTTPPPPQPKPPKQHKKHKRWPWILLLVVLLAAGAAAYYWFTVRKAAAPAKPATASQQTDSTAQSSSTGTPLAQSTATKHYDSSNYLLGLDYPDTWSVADAATKLTVTSPAFTLTDADGKQVSTHAQVVIRSRQTTLAEFSGGNGVAALQSQKLTYKKPTQNQRAQTYLTFVRYANSPAGLDALYITGDNGYQAGQSVPMSDIVQTDPLISVIFLQCNAADCSGSPTALHISADVWNNKPLNAQVSSVLESLAIN